MTRRIGTRSLLPLLSILVIAGTRTSSFAGTLLNTWMPKGLDGQTITALAIDPVTPSTLYAAADRGVFKSTNGASSWTPIGAGRTTAMCPSL